MKFKIPQEVLFNITQPDRENEADIEQWVNNRTMLNCTQIQGLSDQLDCELQSIYCTRNYDNKEVNYASWQ